jgi:hypothetical protein
VASTSTASTLPADSMAAAARALVLLLGCDERTVVLAYSFQPGACVKCTYSVNALVTALNRTLPRRVFTVGIAHCKRAADVRSARAQVEGVLDTVLCDLGRWARPLGIDGSRPVLIMRGDGTVLEHCSLDEAGGSARSITGRVARTIRSKISGSP